uniref:Uncharacterized protein n=1 Tax=Arundo donax TaxID=35708 RepID=A0A0A8YJG6_ARUDO
MSGIHCCLYAFVIRISGISSSCVLERSSFSFAPFPVGFHPASLPTIFEAFLEEDLSRREEQQR